MVKIRRKSNDSNQEERDILIKRKRAKREERKARNGLRTRLMDDLPGQQNVGDCFHSMKAFDNQHGEYVAEQRANDEQKTKHGSEHTKKKVTQRYRRVDVWLREQVQPPSFVVLVVDREVGEDERRTGRRRGRNVDAEQRRCVA